MSNELENDRAVVANLEASEPMVQGLVTTGRMETPAESSLEFDKPDHASSHSDCVVTFSPDGRGCLSAVFAVFVLVTLGFQCGHAST